MKPLRLAVTVLGRALLTVEVGPTDTQPAAASDSQPDTEPGPVTDRRSAPVTSLGFTGQTSQPDHRRAVR